MSAQFSIDHVELFVPDRRKAAQWYETALGLRVLPDFEFWAENPQGPLMISSDGGRTKLALFQGEPLEAPPGTGFRQVAFCASGQDFLDFLDGLEKMYLSNERGERLTAEHVIDHQKSYSIYFVDPYGYRFELTTYDYPFVSNGLRARLA